MTASTRRELRSAATSTSTTAIGLIRALTDARPIKPTSTRCLSARRPNPAEAPLIDAEILFRQPQPPHTSCKSAECARDTKNIQYLFLPTQVFELRKCSPQIAGAKGNGVSDIGRYCRDACRKKHRKGDQRAAAGQGIYCAS